jgi:fluoride exporter
MLRFLLICCGGAAGTGARYLLGVWIGRASTGGFPLATLAVNLIGSFAIGLVAAAALRAGAMTETTRLVLTTGLLGGFTTYSAFNQETLDLARQGAVSTAALNVAGTVLGCAVAGMIGTWIGLSLARGAS